MRISQFFVQKVIPTKLYSLDMEKLPLVRWVIGDTTKNGYESLKLSIHNFLSIYPNVEPIVCCNGDVNKLKEIDIKIINQKNFKTNREPIGVSWKLVPPRLDINRHEIVIDNDLIIEKPIWHINDFFQNNKTLLLEGDSRTYGRFEKHVPKGFQINSGIYGMPPGFDLNKYIELYAGNKWEKNAFGEHDKNETFDEQGIIAIALLDHDNIIIPNTIIANCEKDFHQKHGYHFIGLNRWKHHRPFNLYKINKKKFYL